MAGRAMKMRKLILAASSGVLLALSLPPFNVAGLVWVGLLPLFLALWGQEPEGKRRWRGFGRGFVAGLGFWVLSLKWLTEVTSLGWLVVAAFLALYFGFFGMWVAKVGNPWDEEDQEAERSAWQSSRRSLWYAFICALWWCGLEWVRGWFLSGFGWNGLGVSFHETPVLAQSADLVGVIGLAFLPVFANAIFLQVACRLHGEVKRGKMRAHWDFAVMITLLAGAFLYGVVRLQFAEEGEWQPVRVLMVQLNIPQEASHVTWPLAQVHAGYEEETLGALAEMEEAASLAAEKALRAGEPAEVEIARPDWVVWPESALKEWIFVTDDGEQATGENNRDTLGNVMSSGQFVLMMGLNEIEAVQEGERLMAKDDGYSYNSLVMVRPDKDRFETYRKQHLVLFGETIPLRETIPFMDDIFEKVAGVEFGANFGRGVGSDPMMVPVPATGEEVAVIPSICFEDTVGRHPRKFIKNGGQVIVNVTNDGWFKESGAAAQHFANARFRCIELRRPMVRCSNTGVTAVVNHLGGVEDLVSGARQVLEDAEGNHFTRGTLFATARVPVAGRVTVYARFGDWVGVLGFVLGVGLLGRARFVGRLNGTSD
jgi:apolipoprotein N-acyltransferase